jgi:thiosulfate/3-mercaptopyruvate sulfurtransferase
MPPLVSAAWLESHKSTVRIVDSRWYLDGRSGHAAYLRGHIPGAVWVDLDGDLAAPPSRAAGRHPLPTPEAFAAAMSRLGIGDSTPAVVYDDARGSIAARLWWMLHMLGHDVAVLDGGIDAWTGPLTTDDVAPGQHRSPRARGRQIASSMPMTSMLSALDATRWCSMPAPRRGIRAVTRRSTPAPGTSRARGTLRGRGNVDPDTGLVRAQGELRRRYADLGASDARTIVAYCGSGVTACHDLLALTVAGFGDRLALYPGSWSQWGADDARPVEVVAEPSG